MKLAISILFAMFVMAVNFTTVAQQRTLSLNAPEPVTMNGASTRLPGKYKKIKKKDLKKLSPFTSYSKAVGYAYKDGTKILYFHTPILWDNLDKGLKVWDIGFQLAEDFGEFKFHESGFCQNSRGNGALTYFMKITSKNEAGVSYKLLTFSELNGKLLYGLYIFPEGYKKTLNSSDYISRNDYVAHF